MKRIPRQQSIKQDIEDYIYDDCELAAVSGRYKEAMPRIASLYDARVF